MADKKRDGVRLSASGEEHGKAVLTESAVAELRSRTWTMATNSRQPLLTSVLTNPPFEMPFEGRRGSIFQGLSQE
jgi:hypothetical protein